MLITEAPERTQRQTAHVQSATPPERDDFFAADLTMVTDKGRDVLVEIIGLIEKYEQENCLRRRRRRPDDHRRFERSVDALLANLLRTALLTPSRAIAITRSKRFLSRKTRYDPWYLGKQLPDILDHMQTLDLLDQEIGCRNPFGKDQRTTIKATHRLLHLCTALTLSDIGQSSEGETIILKKRKEDDGCEAVVGNWIDYPDDHRTVLWRNEMERINAWICNADIDYGGPKGTADVTKRRLHRQFLRKSFDLYGRLHGGFWINLSKEQRWDHLLIEGEPVVALDYGQSSIRVAYGLAGATPPNGDLYAIPGLERYRDGVKALINAMFNHDKPFTKKPRGLKGKLPHSHSIETLQRMIKQHHAPIADFFGTDIGLKLNFIESEVIVQVLLRLINQGVTALPVHDCILVKETDFEAAYEVMSSTFKEVVGVHAVVQQETGPWV